MVYAAVRTAQQLQPLSGLKVIYARASTDGESLLGTMSLVDIDVSGHRFKKAAKSGPWGPSP